MARTMKPHMIPLAYMALIFLISMPRIHMSEASGFTIDLIHRDSFQSPSLYSSSKRITNALQRSFHRAQNLLKDHSPQSPSTQIVPDKGEYLMRFSLGTPPVETLAIADTGSDLTWIQCKPCTQCFNQTLPIFDPNHSSTYKPVPCTSSTCTSLQRTSCEPSKGTCSYTMMYGDRSISKGDLATETITLGPTSIPNVTIGCGHVDQGTFGAGASGIVGLGGGQVSLITQMGSLIKGKFSYCLVPYLGETSKPSKMSFSEEAVVSGADVATTPLVIKTPKTYYFLTLEGMTVGNKRLDLFSSSPSSSPSPNDPNASSEEGNIIIDSGTTLTFLPLELYYKVLTAVRSQMKLREVSDPAGLLNLCYLARGDDVYEVPVITAHFRGADVELKSLNTFVRTSQNTLCLAFAPGSSFSIYGNLAQMNFLVGYDLEKKTVSFKPTDCNNA